MLWFGMDFIFKLIKELCGLVRYGVVGFGKVCCGCVRLGLVWFGVVRLGKVWILFSSSLRKGLVW